MAAAYRFFDNNKISPERILQPHIDATWERISQAEVALLVQDTTDLDLTRPGSKSGGGQVRWNTRPGEASSFIRWWPSMTAVCRCV